MLTLIYRGKSKTLYQHPTIPNALIMKFEDDVTAADGAIRMIAKGKGLLNARISAYFFKLLESNGIRTHMISYDNSDTMVVKKLKMIPLEVVIRNYAYGSQLKRMPLFKALQPLKPPIIEYHYKSDELHDPLVLREDVIYAGVVTGRQLRLIEDLSLRINSIMANDMEKKGIKLIDLKLEFGFDENGEIVVGDEITGDSFRALDEKGEHLDKEIFRKTKNVQLLIKRYIELGKRLGVSIEGVEGY
ncbi:MAG: phosphoribosylaminoimidazolesuccinocarboxamide synthase [Desulfurococcaceae archaeon]